MLIVLTIVSLTSSLALGLVYEYTKGPIAAARLAKQVKAVDEVVPPYNNNPVQEKFKAAVPGTSDSLECFPARQDSVLTGMAIRTFSSKGYSGEIWLMAGFEKDGTIRNLIVTDHKETPGLGSKMTEPRFLQQFLGKNPATFTLKVKKDGGAVDGITGATISSRAFCQAVQVAYETYQQQSHGSRP